MNSDQINSRVRRDTMKSFLKSYKSSILLLGSVIVGGIAGPSLGLRHL